MKDVPIEELRAINLELYEAAERIGCTDVSLSGRIWPGGRLSGPETEAARFVEYSWLRAAVVGGASSLVGLGRQNCSLNVVARPASSAVSRR